MRPKKRNWILCRVENRREKIFGGTEKYLSDRDGTLGWKVTKSFAKKFETKAEALSYAIIYTTNHPEFMGEVRVTWTTRR